MPLNKGKRPQAPLTVGRVSLARLTLDIPKALHTRIKVASATRQRSMRDVVIELLEQHFPPDDADEGSARGDGS